jgi:hypothetical protein
VARISRWLCLRQTITCRHAALRYVDSIAQPLPPQELGAAWLHQQNAPAPDLAARRALATFTSKATREP